MTQPIGEPGDGSATLNVNDRRALLEELRALAMNHGATGMESPSLRQRLRAYQRAAWLAARLTWLETEELLTSSGEFPRIDPDATVVLHPPMRVNYPDGRTEIVR